MDCTDSTCQQLNTCKWDMPIASPWCNTIYYTQHQPEPVVQSPPVPSYEDWEDRQRLMKIVEDLRDEVAYFRRTPPPSNGGAHNQPKRQNNKPNNEGGYQWQR